MDEPWLCRQHGLDPCPSCDAGPDDPAPARRISEDLVERELSQVGLAARAVADRVPAELERAILDAVVVHGRPGVTLDDVAGNVQAGSVRLKLYGDRVRVSWAERVSVGGAYVLTGAWSTTDQMRRVVERWQRGQHVNGRARNEG